MLCDDVYVWAGVAGDDLAGVRASPLGSACSHKSVHALGDGVYVWAGGAGADDLAGVRASPLGGARSHTWNKERTFLCLSTIHMF